jgi:Flp pilus assembly protein TadG
VVPPAGGATLSRDRKSIVNLAGLKRRMQCRTERGQTATEFAIVLPVFCLLLFGIIQFGIVFHNYITLTDAVRAGSRKAVVSRDSADPVGEATAAVKKAAKNLDHSKLSVSVTPGPPWPKGSEVTVRATYPYSVNVIGLVVASGDLETEITERVE